MRANTSSFFLARK